MKKQEKQANESAKPFETRSVEPDSSVDCQYHQKITSEAYESHVTSNQRQSTAQAKQNNLNNKQ